MKTFGGKCRGEGDFVTMGENKPNACNLDKCDVFNVSESVKHVMRRNKYNLE